MNALSAKRLLCKTNNIAKYIWMSENESQTFFWQDFKVKQGIRNILERNTE